jgi:plasmid maintenance system antidote protein VapI
MTPARLSEILSDLHPLGLSARRLAAMWGYGSHTSVKQMQAGKQAVPPDMAAWLETLHGWWTANRPA